ncbi:hypothetical protein ACGFNQ_13045 [Streptomyces asoensis]|uniref:hypothetical protein n=1 Tax=Streptomyces TaxID=1883 RepID=UPI00190ACAC8|nr:hypothetical protein [Streptomyces sp. MBT97]MBK3633883.1 hypothetical protein [Streptomyces sp. MBT97]
MCISTGEAAFSGTIVYCGRQHHPVHGLIHVLGYQNTAVNLADGPNAMLLHLPARQRLTPGNFISAGRTGDVLRRMIDAVAPVAVMGDYYGDEQKLLNGDFTISHQDLLAGDLDRVERRQPRVRRG